MRAFIALLLVASAASTASATDTWTTVKPGLKRLHRVTSTQNINVLVVDLCAPGISVRATKESEHPRKVSAFGTLVGVDAAVNANFFNVTTYDPSGPAVANGVSWGGSDSSAVAPLMFGDYRAALVKASSTAGVPAWAKQVVSGHPSLVIDGVTRSNTDGVCGSPEPRTAAGLSADQQTLYLAVVDGRATGRAGMTCNQLATLMKGLGAADAVNLDGGGSSAMWIKGSGVINYPSDGVERTVSTHLGVKATGSGDALYCPAPRYLATTAAEAAPVELGAGASTQVTLSFVNDGNVAWTPAATMLGTQEPQDRASAFATATWPSPARAAAVAEVTEPGATGTFVVELVAPAVDAETAFAETFQLVQDDATWFGPPQTLAITVRPSESEHDGDDDEDVGGGCNSGRSSPGALLVLIAAMIGRDAFSRRRDPCSPHVARIPRSRRRRHQHCLHPHLRHGITSGSRPPRRRRRHRIRSVRRRSHGRREHSTCSASFRARSVAARRSVERTA